LKAKTSTFETANQPVAFDDAALVAECRKGRMEAFGSLVAKYQDRLYNTLLRFCGDRDEAADLCQEAFVRAMEKISGFRSRSRFYTWLYRIAVNLAISRRRREKRVRFNSLTPDPELGDGQAAGLTAELAARRQTDPVRAAMGRETQSRVLEALEALDDEHRVVVVLRDIEEMDYSQMAAVLSVPVGTVKSRLHRARCLLRERLVDIVGSTES